MLIIEALFDIYKISDTIVIKQIHINKYKIFTNTFPDASKRFGKMKINNCNLYMLINMYNHKNIGCILVSKKPNIDIYLKYNIKPKYGITWFFIKDEFRKNNYGKLFFQYILQKYKSLCLKTDNSYVNKAALHIYSKYGFKQIHTEDNKTYWFKK